MKKILSIILALAMVLSLAACGESGATPTEPPKQQADEPPVVSADEPYAVQLLLPTMMAIPAEEDVQVVEDAINDYILNTLGITEYKMDLVMGSLFDYTTTTNMQLAGGQQMDLIYTGPLNTAVANGYLVDLTPYLVYWMRNPTTYRLSVGGTFFPVKT